MGIQRSQEDSWTKEMAKWEHRPVLVNGTYVDPIPREHGGKRDYPFQPYPKMLYRAKSADGGPAISDTMIVDDESAERLSVGQGWSATQEAAIEAVHAQHREFARLAANRAHGERSMSDNAQAEARAVDERTMQHVPVIPETPVKRRGRPAKVTAAA